MVKDNYKLPLKPSYLFKKQEHPKCGLKESIAHFIHLLNTSYFGECRFDESFGCSIWELDFDNLKSGTKLRTLIKASLENSLKKHEARLTRISVDVKIKQEEIEGAKSVNRIKKRIDLLIKGKIKKTNEDFSYIEYFYIGPLSY